MSVWVATSFVSALVAVLSPTAQRANRSKKPQSILGRVLDVRGKPAVGVRVVLRWRVHPELPGLFGHTLGDRGLQELVTKTDKRGRYRFRPPHRGPFLLIADAGALSSVRDFPVMAGGRRTLRLEETPYYGGKVKLPTGKPAAGMTMQLVPHEDAWSRLAAYRIPERRAGTETDANGGFRLTFENGYIRGARWGSFMFPRVETESFSNPTLPILRPTVEARTLALQLAPATLLPGRVFDKVTRKPLGGVRVFDARIPGRSFLTDDEGKFAVALPSIPLWVHPKGYAPRILDKVKAALVLQVERGVRLRAKLVRDESNPIANARVLCVVPNGDWAPVEWTGRTGDDGALDLACMPTDRKVHTFVEIDGVFVKFLATVLRKDVDLGKLRVDSTATIAGRVLSSMNEPLARARVALFSQERRTEPFRITYTDRLGRYEFRAAHPDEVIVSVVADGVGMTHALVKRPYAGKTDLKIPKGQEFQGRVLDPSGEPVAGAWATLWKSSSGNDIPGPSAMTVQCVLTDREGRFRFRGLKSSGWTLQTKYYRGGAFWEGLSSATLGKSVDIKSTKETQ